MALVTQPSLMTQTINDQWCIPKNLKEDLTVYVKDLADKYKRIPIKKPKEKKVKVPKEKKEKAAKVKKEKIPKPPKLTKEEKKALKEQEKLLKTQAAEEEERKMKEFLNKIYLFPLQDAQPDDNFFKEKFKNFKRMNLKKRKKK